MDVKIKRQGDSKILVVTDDKINAKNQFASKERPIVLGTLIHFFNSGEYGLSDFRRKEHLLASPYLEEGSEQFTPKNKEEKDFILSRLHTYKIYTENDKETILWPRFDSSCFDGDIKNPKYSYYACFSYQEAYKRLCEQRDFWLNYESDDLTSDLIRVPNTERQPSASTLSFEMRYPDLAEKTPKILKHK